MTPAEDFASRVVVLAAVAFVAWLGLLVLFRGARGPLAAVFVAALSWALASLSAAWVVGALQHHRLWPLV
jgi:hypothetical protein